MPAVSKKQNNPELSDLIRDHQTRVWRYLRFLGADATEVDDLVQETFVAVWRSSFQHQSDPQTAAYLCKVARNQLLTSRRREGREPNMVELEAAESVWSQWTHSSGTIDYTDAITSCLERIEGRARRAIDLHYRDGQSRADIADRLEMKPDGVKTLLRRTRDKLRECVERKVKHQ